MSLCWLIYTKRVLRKSVFILTGLKKYPAKIMNGLIVSGFIIFLSIDIDKNGVTIQIADELTNIRAQSLLSNIRGDIANNRAIIVQDEYAHYPLMYYVKIQDESVGAHPNVKLELYKNDEDENYTLWFKFEGQGVGVDFETQIDAAEIEGDNIFFMEKQTFATEIYSTR